MYKQQVPRKELYELLSSLKGGLAGKDVVPILSSFCFDDGCVYTYDGVVTMRAACPQLEGFRGGMRGEQLLAWLGKVGGESVTLTIEGTAARWSCGRRRLSTPVQSPDDFQHDVGMASANTLPGDRLAPLLREAMRSLGLDPLHEWRLGATLIFARDGVEMYASDSVTCTSASVDLPVPEELDGTSVVLPPRFLELLAKDRSVPADFHFDGNAVRAVFESGTILQTRTLGKGRPASHRGPFKHFDWNGEAFANVPGDLAGVLDSCSLVFEDKASGTATLRVDQDVLVVEAKTSRGEVYEELPVEADSPEGLHSCEVVVSPAMVKRCSDGARLFRVTGNGVQFITEAADVIVSVLQNDEG